MTAYPTSYVTTTFGRNEVDTSATALKLSALVDDATEIVVVAPMRTEKVIPSPVLVCEIEPVPVELVVAPSMLKLTVAGEVASEETTVVSTYADRRVLVYCSGKKRRIGYV